MTQAREWFEHEINALQQSILSPNICGSGRWRSRGSLKREIAGYHRRVYENEGNRKFFGVADGYFTGRTSIRLNHQK
jgi:hypothetical protein